jgi:hypothetical protein
MTSNIGGSHSVIRNTHTTGTTTFTETWTQTGPGLAGTKRLQWPVVVHLPPFAQPPGGENKPHTFPFTPRREAHVNHQSTCSSQAANCCRVLVSSCCRLSVKACKRRAFVVTSCRAFDVFSTWPRQRQVRHRQHILRVHQQRNTNPPLPPLQTVVA